MRFPEKLDVLTVHARLIDETGVVRPDQSNSPKRSNLAAQRLLAFDVRADAGADELPG